MIAMALGIVVNIAHETAAIIWQPWTIIFLEWPINTGDITRLKRLEPDETVEMIY